MHQEALKQREIKEIHFKPEGYIADSGVEFLDQFIARLRAEHLNPDDLIFSGFDGLSISKGEALPRHPSIFGMNEAAWREAARLDDMNPAVYTRGSDKPCIGLYDRSQLAWAYSYGIKDGSIDDRMVLNNIVLGENLVELSPDVPVEEAIVHIDYPHRFPDEALVGLVFLEDV